MNPTQRIAWSGKCAVLLRRMRAMLTSAWRVALTPHQRDSFNLGQRDAPPVRKHITSR